MLSEHMGRRAAMKFVYMATKGAEDPTLASIPLHMALNGSVEVGHDVAIVLVGHAAEIILGENAEKLEGIGVPSMRELLAKASDHNVPVYV
jgi:predicted peroxiredoxin